MAAGRPWEAKPAGYFEARSNGSTYVFGSAQAAADFTNTGKIDGKTYFFPDGTVVIDRNGGDALLAEYQKQHK